MFRPVTTRRRRRRRGATSSASLVAAVARAARRPVLPRGADRPAVAPTCERRRRADRRTRRRGRTRGDAVPAHRRRRAPADLGRRRARATARTRCGALAERLAAPVLTTYGARGVLPPEHPCSVGMPPHVEPAGPAVGRGRPRDRVRLRPRRHEHAELAPAAAAAHRRRQRRPRRRGEELRASTRSPARSTSSRIRQRDGDVGARACARSAPRRAATLDAARAALPRRDLLRAARRRQRRLRHVHPRLLDRRLPRLPPPAQAAVPDGLGHARASRSRPRSARRSPAPARPSRSPATAASCSPAASSPRWRRSGSRSPR